MVMAIWKMFCIVSWPTWYFSVCNKCSVNAICEEGVCICKPGYRGDGIRCDFDGKFYRWQLVLIIIYGSFYLLKAICGNNLSLNAACEERQCVCNTGDGMICDGKLSIYSMMCMEMYYKYVCDYRWNGMTCNFYCWLHV